MSNWGDNTANWSGQQVRGEVHRTRHPGADVGCWKVGGAEGDMQRFDNSVDNALDRGVQGVEDAPDDVARFAGDQVRRSVRPLAVHAS